MKFLKLCNGQELPQIGLGLWQVDDPVEFENAVVSALDLGYRYFDIAYTYKNEAQLGAALKKQIDAGKVKREELFISTKLPQIGMTRDKVDHFLTLSLEALQMTYFDAYLMHFPVGFKYVNEKEIAPRADDGSTLIDLDTDLASVWAAMEKQVDTGRVKVIGLSNCNALQVQRIWDLARIKPALLQVELNVYLQQNKLLDVCKKLNISVVGYGNLGSPGRKEFFEKIGRPSKELHIPAILEDPGVIAIGTKHGKVPAQIALKFLTERGVACIPSATIPEFQQQNIGIFDFTLDESDMRRLTALDQGEAGRSFTMQFFKGAQKHPEFPFQEWINYQRQQKEQEALQQTSYKIKGKTLKGQRSTPYKTPSKNEIDPKQ